MLNVLVFIGIAVLQVVGYALAAIGTCLLFLGMFWIVAKVLEFIVDFIK